MNTQKQTNISDNKMPVVEATLPGPKATQDWHKIEVRDTHTCWERITDDGAIFCVYPNDEIPTETSGGYYKFETAWTIKGFNP